MRALETVLTEKGYIDPAALDRIVETFETKIGPHIGARIVAKAWADPTFKKRLLEDASTAINADGSLGRVGDHLIAVENTPRQRHMIVCTLCSCYPWEVLGLPPVWYKSAAYRSRAVHRSARRARRFRRRAAAGHRHPRLGFHGRDALHRLADAPDGTEGWSEEKLAALVTRDSMIGTGLPKPQGRVMNGIHDMGGMHGFGPVEPEPNEPVFHADWEGHGLALNRAMGYTGIWTIDQTRAASRSCRPTSISRVPTTRNGRYGWRTSSSRAASPAPTSSKPATRCVQASR